MPGFKQESVDIFPAYILEQVEYEGPGPHYLSAQGYIPHLPSNDHRGGPVCQSLNVSNHERTTDTSSGSHRRKRTSYSQQKLVILENYFQTNRYPDINDREQLAKKICLPESRVQVWFQNRRARAKREEAKVDTKPVQSPLYLIGHGPNTYLCPTAQHHPLQTNNQSSVKQSVDRWTQQRHAEVPPPLHHMTARIQTPVLNPASLFVTDYNCNPPDHFSTPEKPTVKPQMHFNMESLYHYGYEFQVAAKDYQCAPYSPISPLSSGSSDS
ncbi:mix1 homeobox [Pelobates cultripes]|uniref:Mix1 homeobox n=1 Tax=Pelobates cultripes TaxID=61616 RepID=A0AAD1RI10_PELCU|nr:mix1 homeobox [Pelobates cultripes]